MANFFTADTHFNHLKIMEMANRPFKTVDKMNDFIIDNINKKVTAKDTLWVLGDFCLGQDSVYWAQQFRKQMNVGRLNLIVGNHDYRGHRKYDFVKYVNTFDEIHFQWIGKIEEQFMYLHHYASRTWPEQSRQSWMLYGHSHSNLPDDVNALSIDVGVDTEWEGIHERFTPYSMDELRQVMSKKVYVDVDHHTKDN